MAETILSIAVPAYNSEHYLGKCLDSMAGADARLEVIVVDDGSTDGTGVLVQEYVRRFPRQVSLISKDNGGHGSGINTAVEIATGRYFKVVDADDWIRTDQLPCLLDALERTCADAVITGYHTINEATGKVMAYPCTCRYAGQKIDLKTLLEVYDNISFCCSFHGILYRTQFYRECGFRLSEGIFYEDHEYATLPFAHLNSILILPLFFYQYRIGTSGQSVAFHNQVKRIDQIEQVIIRILDYREQHAPLRSDRDEYLLRKLSVVVVSYFAIALVKDPDRATGRAKAQRFRELLDQYEPQLNQLVKKKYKTLVLFHRIHFPAKLYQRVLNTAFYKMIRQIWTS